MRRGGEVKNRDMFWFFLSKKNGDHFCGLINLGDGGEVENLGPFESLFFGRNLGPLGWPNAVKTLKH